MLDEEVNGPIGPILAWGTPDVILVSSLSKKFLVKQPKEWLVQFSESFC